MARYERLLAMDLAHEFHGGDAVPNLRWVLTADTAVLMEREGLLLRATVGGFEIWRDQDVPLPNTEWQLGIDVYTSDALLRFCTQWPDGYLPMAAGTLPALQVLRAVAQPAPDTRDGGPLLWIDIACRAVAAADQALQLWRVQLQAKSIHWKYFFSGGLAVKKLCIVDLDAAEKGEGMVFLPSPMTATVDGAAYLSASPVPMQYLPQQRLQLQEEGAAGRVLIRRLPNASVEKLGKERGPNGQSMIVAEIYVHQ
jgi:hypothetical protein